MTPMFFSKVLCFLFALFCGSRCLPDEQTLQRKERIVCKDVISFVTLYTMPSDPDVNKIWNTCLNFCLAKVSLIERMKVAPPEEKKDLLISIEKMEPMLSASLYALRMSFFMFAPPYNLRMDLTELYKKIQEADSTPFLLMN